MRKIFSALLVVALFAPAIGLVCHCCNMSRAKSSAVSIQANDCGCCQTRELKQDQRLVGWLETLIPAFIKDLLSRFSPADSVSTLAKSANRDAAQAVLGPPVFSPHIPLYLATQILRI